MEQAYINRKNKKILIFTSLGIITSLAALTPLFISCKNNTDKDKNDYEEQIKPNNYEQDFKLFYSELRKHLTQDYGFEWDDKSNKIKIVIEPTNSFDRNYLIKLINMQISRALANSRFNISKSPTNHNDIYNNPPTFYSTDIWLNNGSYSIKKEVGFNVVVNDAFLDFKYKTRSFSEWLNYTEFKTMLQEEKQDKNKIISIVKSQFFRYLYSRINTKPSININFDKKINLFNFEIEKYTIKFNYELTINDGCILSDLLEYRLSNIGDMYA